LHESAQEKTVPLSERRIRDKGLKPGWDGALLTADGSLLHMRLACYYSVAEGWDVQTGLNNAVLFRINVDDQPAEQIRGEEESLHSQDILRAVVCRAAILAATTQTAEKLRTNTEDFTNEVEALAQAQLDELKTGLRITNINVASISWPLQIRDQVAEANKARQERETQINNALAEARTLLSRTAGGSFERLAGEVESLVSDRSARQVQQQAELAQEYERAKEAGDYDKVRELLTQFRSAGLVEQYTSARQADDERLAEDILAEMKREERPLIEVYTVAREAGEEQLADELLAMIDEVLLSGGTTGRAQSIIQQARSSRQPCNRRSHHPSLKHNPRAHDKTGGQGRHTRKTERSR
jgi:regulator of protease activity HflC (stomatin/prohibitin superfamily)